nr:MAG TPA: hypothetical protein [Caudoviricetes sp.]
MERLTERIKRPQKDDLIVYTNGKYEDTIPAEMTNDDIRAVLKKLAAYEDLEEQGLLVRLPCKVGNTVYVPTRNFISELRITMISINNRGTLYFSWVLDNDKGIYPNLDGFSGYELGKTVFLTREEAEKKLEEMKKND